MVPTEDNQCLSSQGEESDSCLLIRKFVCLNFPEEFGGRANSKAVRAPENVHFPAFRICQLIAGDLKGNDRLADSQLKGADQRAFSAACACCGLYFQGGKLIVGLGGSSELWIGCVWHEIQQLVLAIPSPLGWPRGYNTPDPAPRAQ